jgi:hypothetical protein
VATFQPIVTRPNLNRFGRFLDLLVASDVFHPLIYPPGSVRFDNRAKLHVSYFRRRRKQVLYGNKAKRFNLLERLVTNTRHLPGYSE